MAQETFCRLHAQCGNAHTIERKPAPIVSPWVRAALERRLPVKEYAR